MIELKNIVKSVNNGRVEQIILDKMDIKIDNGDFIAIKGKSGVGKTTLLNILSGLDGFQSGKYYFKGKNITKYTVKERTLLRRNNIGIVTQQFHLLKDRNVFENIALPLQCDKVKKSIIKEKVEYLLKELELDNYKYTSVTQLSGGEQQRVAIARAIIREPSILLADEPTGALDEETEDIIMNIFTKLNEQGIAIVIVTHDVSVAERCKKVYTLTKGKLLINDN